MEVSMLRGYTDLGLEDLSFIHQHLHHHQMQVNSIEDLFKPQVIIPSYGSSNNYHQELTNQTMISCKNTPKQPSHQITLAERPAKQIKPNDWSRYDIDQHHVMNSQDSSTKILCFGNNNISNNCGNQAAILTPKEEVAVSAVTFHPPKMLTSDQDGRNTKDSSVHANPSQARDHILAERKRREKLSQRFCALSAIVPGLKKMDKATVLGDAIKYMKQLQERVSTLEEQAKKRTVESGVFVKRSKVFANDDNSYGEEQFSQGDCADTFPEIEVRVSNKDVLIRIHCAKKSGILEKLITQIENLHLVVNNSSALAFGDFSIELTIIAQMGVEFDMKATDVVKHLHAALTRLI